MACLPSRLYGFKSHYPHLIYLKSYMHIDLITSLLQLSIKKGKKSKSEKELRKMFIFLIKTNKQLDLISLFNNVQKNIQPAIKLQKRKHTYKPTYATDKHQLNKASAWLLKELKKGNNKFYKALAIELLETAANTSNSIKNRQALYQTATQNIFIKT